MDVCAIDITAEQRKTVLALLARHLPNTTAWVYGSRVKWTARPESDLDLVVFATPEQAGRVSDLREVFEESNLPFRVDLFVWDAVPEQFRKTIEAEHVVLVERSGESFEGRSSRVLGEWVHYRLEDCMAAIIDYRGKTPRKTPSGIPLITARLVKGGRIKTPTEFIAIEDYDSWMRRGVPRRGDVLITTEAPLGEVAQLDRQRVALAQRLILLRGKSGILNNRFLNFLIQSAPVQDQLRARASGTTVLGIKQRELRQIGIVLPPIQEQRAIAHILGTLDDKIELNRRMNQTLEAMAQALFKSWFVDFDPVRAKAALKNHSLSRGSDWTVGRARACLERMDPNSAALFPDSFVDSELGPIPAGWEVKALGECAAQRRRGVSPEQIDAGTPYIALEHMPKRCIALPQWGTAGGLASSKFRFEQRDILFGKLRPYFHKVGVAPIGGVCSTDIVVISPVSDEWFGFVLGHASSSEFVHYTNATSTGTKMPRTNWTDMSRYQVPLPGQKLAGVFTRSIQPPIDRIVSSVQESRFLTAVRDALLPKLISGELREGKRAARETI